MEEAKVFFSPRLDWLAAASALDDDKSWWLSLRARGRGEDARVWTSNRVFDLTSETHS